jgi:hypothetical protein
LKGKAEAILEKNRGRELSRVLLRFKGWCYSFEDAETQ